MVSKPETRFIRKAAMSLKTSSTPNSLGRAFTEAYLFQLSLQVESLMDRKFLEDLDESYKVHIDCRWLKKKMEKKNIHCCSDWLNNIEMEKVCLVQ